jgi:hypothetical protein
MAEAALPTCEVHHEPLATQEVRIQYGLIRGSPKVSPDYLAARRRYFPHCDDVVLGGCVVRETRARPKGVCPACCTARNRWLRQHCSGWVESHDPSGV